MRKLARNSRMEVSWIKRQRKIQRQKKRRWTIKLQEGFAFFRAGYDRCYPVSRQKDDGEGRYLEESSFRSKGVRW